MNEQLTVQYESSVKKTKRKLEEAEDELSLIRRQVRHDYIQQAIEQWLNVDDRRDMLPTEDVQSLASALALHLIPDTKPRSHQACLTRSRRAGGSSDV